MIRVHVKNFQSIVQSTVDIDGLTVITGPNNSGKTALMRAIRGVFTNAKGNSFVRYGADTCEVTLEFPDGNTVTWEKGKTTNRYTVNGKLLDKVGQGVPDEVEALGVTSITAGSQTVWPQIAPQFTGQVFLLDQAGSVVAEALADVERVGKLSRALKAVDSDKRQAQSELKVRRADAKALVTEMAAFDGLDDAVKEVTTVEQSVAALKADQTRIEELSALSTRLDGYQQQVTKLAGIQTVSVPVADEPVSIAKDGANLSALMAIRDRLNKAKADHTKYAGADILTCPPAVELGNAKQELLDLKALLGKRTTAQTACDKLAGFTAPDLDAGKTDKAGRALEVLRGIKTRRDGHVVAMADLQNEAHQAKADLAAAEAAVQDILNQMPACPTCGQGHKGCP